MIKAPHPWGFLSAKECVSFKMDDNLKNVLIDSIPHLSNEAELAIFNVFKNLGLHNCVDIYSAMDYELTDDGKPSDDTVPDDWTKKNFEGIIDINQQMHLCTNILTEVGEEIRTGRLKGKGTWEPLEQKLRKLIITLLKDKNYRMPASDIDAYLKYQDVDKIKALCEKMYHNGEISRTANYRYFILIEEKKKPKKASISNSEAVDVKVELKKFKELLDEGLITQEAYDAKMNQLLGL